MTKVPSFWRGVSNLRSKSNSFLITILWGPKQWKTNSQETRTILFSYVFSATKHKKIAVKLNFNLHTTSSFKFRALSLIRFWNQSTSRGKKIKKLKIKWRISGKIKLNWVAWKRKKYLYYELPRIVEKSTKVYWEM